MEHYSFTTLLVTISVGVTALAVVLPTLHKMARGKPEPTAVPEAPQWTHAARPTRCMSCGEPELVRLGEVTVSPKAVESSSPLLPSQLLRPIDCEMLICGACGRSELYASSPNVLKQVARRSLPPYR